MSSRILLVDDDFQGLESSKKILEMDGYRVDTAGDGQEALEKLRSRFSSPGERYDLVLTDVRMPRMGGLEFLKALKLCDQNIPVVLMTAYGSVDDAVWAMKMGAVDFLTKPFKRQVLLSTIRTALQRTNYRGVSLADDSHAASDGTDDLIGVSQPILALKQQIQQVAPTTATVLILGESGSGKEKVARWVHQRSNRANAPFVAMNCAAMPEALIESELFGFEKGAFTGAHSSRAGLFESAHGGTLLLDEIGDMPLLLQAKLLRVLQEGEIKRIGSNRSIPVDVRIIAATHQNLAKMVSDGKFRQDLLYRLEVITLSLPPLRERKSDIPLLAEHFLKRSVIQHQKNIHNIDPAAMSALVHHSWPGNIRELSNVIERAVILSNSAEIKWSDLPEHIRQVEGGTPFSSMWAETIQIPLGTSLREVEELLILKTLEATAGDKNMAAKLLGTTSRTIYRKLDQLHPKESVEFGAKVAESRLEPLEFGKHATSTPGDDS